MKFIIVAFLALGLFASCQSTRSFQEPGFGWRTYQGQLRYSDTERSLIGEVVVASMPPHNFQVDYVAGPGFPLLRIREDRTQAVAEGVLARGRWQGSPEGVPERYRTIFALRDVFNRVAALPRTDRTSETLSGAAWTAEVAAENGRVTVLDVRFPASGERFQFVFPPRRR